MVDVIWTENSLNNINNIAEFIAKDSVKYAKIQVKRFFDAAKRLESNPKSGRIVPEINNKSLRELILGNYRLIYKIVTAKRVDIITIHHSARSLANNPAL